MVPPEKMPATPRPVIARPITKAMEEGAVAQIINPMVKTMNEARNVAFMGKTV
jgi:hypothetical protein